VAVEGKLREEDDVAGDFAHQLETVSEGVPNADGDSNPQPNGGIGLVSLHFVPPVAVVVVDLGHATGPEVPTYVRWEELPPEPNVEKNRHMTVKRPPDKEREPVFDDQRKAGRVSTGDPDGDLSLSCLWSRDKEDGDKGNQKEDPSFHDR